MIAPTVSGMGDTGLSYQSKSLIQSVSMKVRWTNGKKPCTMQSVEYQRSAHYHNKWVRCVVCLGRIVFRLPVCKAERADVLGWFNHYLIYMLYRSMYSFHPATGTNWLYRNLYLVPYKTTFKGENSSYYRKIIAKERWIAGEISAMCAYFPVLPQFIHKKHCNRVSRHTLILMG